MVRYKTCHRHRLQENNAYLLQSEDRKVGEARDTNKGFVFRETLYIVQFLFTRHSLDLSDNVLHDWLFPHHCIYTRIIKTFSIKMKEDVPYNPIKQNTKRCTYVGLYGSGLFNFGSYPNLVRMLFGF